LITVNESEGDRRKPVSFCVRLSVLRHYTLACRHAQSFR